MTDLSAPPLGASHQHTRLLRLHTPLGADVLLAESATIEEGIGPMVGHGQHRGAPFGFRAEILALSHHAALNPAELLGRPVLLELLTAHSRTELRPFHGHVTRFELLGSDGGLARYRLVVEPFTAFLAHRVDAWSYQGLSVQGVVEALLTDYQGQGTLAPALRWELLDASAYPVLSLHTQHHETDLQFLQRTLALHGLFAWFEHQGLPQEATLGRHTLVVADHAGALKANAQAQVRFTQSGTVLKEDSITRWHTRRRVGPTELGHASWDYRVVNAHAASQQVSSSHEQPMPLRQVDQPGTYAFEGPEQAQRAATHRLQALEAQRERFEGRATVRTLAPATTFELLAHPEHSGQRFVLLQLTHRARNNLPTATPESTTVNSTTTPLYEVQVLAQRAEVPVRPEFNTTEGFNAHRNVEGVQTAIVVGLQEAVHTDRDGRIKVQFHRQRGSQGSHRLPHPTPSGKNCNAPANSASGTWVRVSQAWAGANWGSVFTPRLGQEVLVAFVEGDIDRPIVIGSAYNGQACADAQGNEVGTGAATATGNAPAWFPGSQAEGPHEGHAHTSSLSGIKTQSLETSQTGPGAHNQLVLDDTPGQGRVLAHTTQHQTWLQLGHLLQQDDNQRLAPRGQGLELHTLAQGAIRAGSGLHISGFARQGGSSTAGQPTQTTAARQQLSRHAELVQALGQNAHAQQAQLPGEAPQQLLAHQALQATLSSLKAEQNSQGPGTEGGHGRIPTLARPDLVLSSPGAISSATPASTVAATGQHFSLSTEQSAQWLSQRHSAWAVKGGISLFTRGDAQSHGGPVQDTGIKLHAASGNVSVQAQSAPLKVTALQALDVQSTQGRVVISAPQRITLNGGGGYLKIEGGNIEIGTGGGARFRAGMKELGGGASASTPGMSFAQSALTMPKRPLQVSLVNAEGELPTSEPLTLRDGAGVEHAVTVAGGAAHIADFKPGLTKSSQPKRKG